MHATASRILAASRTLLSERGISSLRVEDLLDAADVSRRTFYKHFRGKEGVTCAIYQQVTDEIAAAISATEIALDDPLGGIRNALDAYLAVVDNNRELMGPLHEEAIRADSALAPIRRTFRTKLVNALELVFAAAFGRRVDPLVFYALVSAVEGLSLDAFTNDPSIDSERIRAVAEGLLRTIAANPQLLPLAPPNPDST
jgi:AcrR family transcriptional regulator